MQEQKDTQKAIKLEKKHKVNTTLMAGWMPDGVEGEQKARPGEGQGFEAAPPTPMHVCCWWARRGVDWAIALLIAVLKGSWG